MAPRDLFYTDSMRVILQGSMQHFAASELLTLLAGPAHSGTFDAESGEKRVRLFISEGRLQWAEGSAGRDVLSLVTDLVTWTDGSFTFLDALALPDDVTPLAFDPTALLAEAQRRIAEAHEILRLYPDEQTVFRVVPQPVGDVTLHAEEFQILFKVGTGRSLAQLRSDTRRSALELYPLIRSLQTGGLIEVAPAFDPDATSREASIPRKSISRKKTTAEQKVQPIATLTPPEGSMHPIMQDEVTVGRSDANGIVLSDASVSSRHARILRAGGAFVLEDLGSRNGTFVNGDKVTEKRPLADGDVVRFGKVLLTFNIAVVPKVRETTQPEVRLPRRTKS
jgi:hypothetical protein